MSSPTSVDRSIPPTSSYKGVVTPASLAEGLTTLSSSSKDIKLPKSSYKGIIAPTSSSEGITSPANFNKGLATPTTANKDITFNGLQGLKKQAAVNHFADHWNIRDNQKENLKDSTKSDEDLNVDDVGTLPAKEAVFSR